MSTKSTTYRMPEDILRELDRAAELLKTDKTDLLCRLARYGLRQMEKDRGFLVSDDALRDLPDSKAA